MKALLPIKHSEGLEYRWEEKRKIDDDNDDDGEKKDGRLINLDFELMISTQIFHIP